MNEVRQKHQIPSWAWCVGGVCAPIILIVLFRPLPNADRSGHSQATSVTSSWSAPTPPLARSVSAPRHSSAVVEPSLSPEEIVASRLKQFSHSRRNLAHALADHFKTAFSDQIERFFDAAEGGRYDEMEAIYKSLSAQRQNGTDTRWYGPVWRSVFKDTATT